VRVGLQPAPLLGCRATEIAANASEVERAGRMQRMQVPSRLLVWPDENHWILKGENSRFFYQEVYAWLKKYLGAPNDRIAE